LQSPVPSYPLRKSFCPPIRLAWTASTTSRIVEIVPFCRHLILWFCPPIFVSPLLRPACSRP
jgi:hypothetical protein